MLDDSARAVVRCYDDREGAPLTSHPASDPEGLIYASGLDLQTIINYYLVVVSKSFKLATKKNNRDDVYVTFFREPEDSGIDSDNKPMDDDGQSSESSIDAQKGDWFAPTKNYEDRIKVMEEVRFDHEAALPLIPWQRCDMNDTQQCSGRSSPLLYEVELTASDEDDDNSVLELVIPIQSTTKSKKLSKRVECSFFFKVVCCFRR